MVAFTLSGAALSMILAVATGSLLLREASERPRGPTAPVVFPAPWSLVVEASCFGPFAGVALAIAQSVGVDRPYWVPISCIAIMRGQAWQRRFRNRS